jgi:hypothetical protein
MSNQDPYGTPPEQPYGQQPYGQQPYAGGQGFGSGPGGPGYPGTPPPPKKRTGLIVGAIVAALVVIGGLVVGGIVLLGGDDDKDETSSEKATDEPTEEPTEEPTDEPTETGDTVSGTNYTYSLPGEQWVDATADAAAAGTVVDSAAAWGEQIDGSRANVLVEAASAEGTLEAQRDGWETNLTSGGSNLERLPNVSIDGENAYAVQLQGTNSSGTEIFQTVYLTVHQEIVYSIGFSSQPADDEAEAGFDVIKNSWAWTS